MGLWQFTVIGAMLAAQAASVHVSGTVREAGTGLPIAGAVVSLADLERVVFTDELGRYLIDAPPGSHHVNVRRLGYTPQSFDAIVALLLVMAILGGAILPPLQGLVADLTKNLQISFIVPMIAYAYVAFYGAKGHAIGRHGASA
jgi:hypothetical protein